MKKILLVLIAAFLLISAMSITTFAETQNSSIVDHADLLSNEEESLLKEELSVIRNELSFDVVVVTVSDLEGKSPMDFADDFYDYNGYGYGEERDGCLLLIHMDSDRGYWISTAGYGLTALTDYGIEFLVDKIVPYLSDGEYYNAFRIFSDDVKLLVESAQNGEVFDVEYTGSITEKSGFQVKSLIYGAIAGLIIALIVIAVLQGQLKSVDMKASANDYYIDGSLAISGSYDRFVGRRVTRTKKDKESSGGSSSHRSSSGSRHGGGGGKF